MFAPCLAINGLSVCPTDTDLYDVLVLAANRPVKTQTVLPLPVASGPGCGRAATTDPFDRGWCSLTPSDASSTPWREASWGPPTRRRSSRPKARRAGKRLSELGAALSPRPGHRVLSDDTTKTVHHSFSPIGSSRRLYVRSRIAEAMPSKIANVGRMCSSLKKSGRSSSATRNQAPG